MMIKGVSEYVTPSCIRRGRIKMAGAEEDLCIETFTLFIMTVIFVQGGTDILSCHSALCNL